MNAQIADLAHLREAGRGPGLPGVAGAIDASSQNHVAADPIASGSDKDDVRIRLRHFDCSDGAGLEEAIGDGPPGDPVVVGLEDAPARRAQIERSRLLAMSGHRGHSPAPGGTDHAVAQAAEKLRVDGRSQVLGSRLGSGQGKQQGGHQRSAFQAHDFSLEDSRFLGLFPRVRKDGIDQRSLMRRGTDAPADKRRLTPSSTDRSVSTTSSTGRMTTSPT